MPLQLLALALDAALYPTLLAAVALLLSQERRRPLLAAYLAGGLTVSIAVGLGIVALLQGSGAVRSDRSGASWITDVSVGGLALLLAVALATRVDVRLKQRRRPAGGSDPAGATHATREPLSQRILSRGSVPVVFLASLAINLPGAAYLVGLKDIAVGDHGTGGVIALVVAFNLVMFTLAEVPLVGLAVAPERTVALVVRANRWFSENGRRIAIVLSAVLGVYLVARGVAKA
ncbi:Sulfolipid-1 exporter Sap [Baekduia alba]|uniref:GAP family protein n=1 Tax=Baekduia alba TaxID=2997333 RepID=UPI00233FF0D2|nr:GAP family protein [Baekduia alba]WCB95200.1 Sulfolipid-1 exporter Sap [Baekduia alba]